MSAIQAWPQELVQPVTWRRICWSKPGRRSSSSATSHLLKALVSAMASLQNSVPVQAMAPRQKAEVSTVQAEGVELDDERGGLAVGNVDDEDVLADGGAELAVAVLVGEIGEFDELIAGETAVEDGGSDGGEAGLALRGDADVVAVDVGGD